MVTSKSQAMHSMLPIEMSRWPRSTELIYTNEMLESGEI